MRFTLLRIFFLLCVSFLLAGCGKKGALYLPDSSAIVPASSAAAPQPTQPVRP